VLRLSPPTVIRPRYDDLLFFSVQVDEQHSNFDSKTPLELYSRTLGHSVLVSSKYTYSDIEWKLYYKIECNISGDQIRPFKTDHVPICHVSCTNTMMTTCFGSLALTII
jgi:hypothetical protein